MKLAREVDRTKGGYALARELSDRADKSITALFNSCLLEGLDRWFIAALGGYGRRELCPFSDLDILFLMERKTSQVEIEKVLRETLYPLWDAGFNASYSVRTIRQAILDAKNDFFLRTSLIDARLVCGSEPTFRKFSERMASSSHFRNSRKFIADLAFHTRKRHEKYGDSVYFLEPHIKEGQGGLRDYQGIFWAAEILRKEHGNDYSPIGQTDIDELHSTADFMTKVRFLLHRLTGRKTDRMHIEYQDRLAAEMGYTAGDGESAVEAFLKDFHKKALTVRLISDGLFMQLTQPKGWGYFRSRRMIDEDFIVSSGLLSFTCSNDAKDNPLLVLKAFLHLADKGLYLATSARSQIKEATKGFRSFYEDPQACGVFLKILKSPGAEKALVGMLETGVIERLIPEFQSIRAKTIFDVYHTYTIDLHSIHTVCELKRLEKNESEVFSRIEDRDVLYLSSFLHDIGKGYGKPHAVTGVEIIKPIAGRFGFDKTRTELAVFLVRNHLLLADIAVKRDLSEEKVILDLAQKIGSIEGLSMLYLLTVADTKATGPNAWNEWKASLFREVYTKTLNVLEKGILKDRKNANRLEAKWKELIRQAQTEDGPLLSGRLWVLPQAYVLSSDINDIKRHISLSQSLSVMDDMRIDTVHRKNHTTLTVITRDRPGLFALLTGILAINRIEITSANIFTWYDGTVVDTFRVLPPWKDYNDWHTIENQFRDFLSGKSDLNSRLTKTRALKTNEPDAVPSHEESVLSIDNISSDFFTIIDVRAQKRIGLVHDISKKISEFGYNIHRAFLSRSSDLFSLVYYIVDTGGEKITDEGRKKEIFGAIEEVIRIP